MRGITRTRAPRTPTSSARKREADDETTLTPSASVSDTYNPGEISIGADTTASSRDKLRRSGAASGELRAHAAAADLGSGRLQQRQDSSRRIQQSLKVGSGLSRRLTTQHVDVNANSRDERIGSVEHTGE